MNFFAIATQAYPAVIAARRDLLQENGYDPDHPRWANAMPVDLEDHELYLYVQRNGDWCIDALQYYCGPTAYACAPIAAYASAEDLATELEISVDWPAQDDHDANS